jgi:aryl-alcohol dehydrogenase-like predicted oxidoreductase
MVISELKERGQVAPALIDEDDPLGFLMHEGGAVSIQDAAYRFCRFEPGAHIVLSGTGNLEHLEANVASILRPPLPEPDLLKLKSLFAKVDSISGN